MNGCENWHSPSAKMVFWCLKNHCVKVGLKISVFSSFNISPKIMSLFDRVRLFNIIYVSTIWPSVNSSYGLSTRKYMKLAGWRQGSFKFLSSKDLLLLCFTGVLIRRLNKTLGIFQWKFPTQRLENKISQPDLGVLEVN